MIRSILETALELTSGLIMFVLCGGPMIALAGFFLSQMH